MRALYSTHKHIRVFVLGVPEGWLVDAYDLVKHEWIAGASTLHDTLREAKADALEKMVAVVGERPLRIQWH